MKKITTTTLIHIFGFIFKVSILKFKHLKKKIEILVERDSITVFSCNDL